MSILFAFDLKTSKENFLEFDQYIVFYNWHDFTKYLLKKLNRLSSYWYKKFR
jgi:hypothetical protein